MSQSTRNVLVIGGTAIAGGAAGSWLGARLAATRGLQLGPWGVVAGALVGALAGSMLSGYMPEDDTAAALVKSEDD
jgi:outer membrane lipoprotein SlyB